ncbi:MAG: AAA family ATPase [Actinomycetota bacterium]
MRPLSLRLRGFTSFREEQEIDFTDLDLFALWGPMGSGKSSVLDAMTYALYGHVERVGREAAQLVSQGQPYMAVTLDFSVSGVRYRVARRTPGVYGSGPTRVLLEVSKGDEWVSAGPGADSVREVNRMIKGIIGLDYEAFSRSVVLPQGKFAEFLTGEAKHRRKILTELLGLELFKKMAQRSNEVARDARNASENKQQFIDTDYQGVDEAALRGARTTAKRARNDAGRALDAQRALEAAAREWEVQERSIADLQACDEEIGELAHDLSVRAARLEAHGEALAAALRDVEETTETAGIAGRRLDEAQAEIGSAESTWGRVDEIAALRERALRVGDLRGEFGAAQGSVSSEEDKEAAARAGLAPIEKELARARRRQSNSLRALEQATARHHEAYEADAVAALVADLEPGDACPVCDRPLEDLPAPSPEALQEAKQELHSAEAAKEAAEQAVHSLDRRLDVARNTLEHARASVERCRSELAVKESLLTTARTELEVGFGADPPDEADAILAQRLSVLKDRIEVREQARVDVEKARHLAEESRRRVAAIERDVAEERAALHRGGLEAVLERAKEAAPEAGMAAVWPAELPRAAEDLAAVAAGAARRLGELHKAVQEALDARLARRASMVAEARAAVPSDLGIAGEDLGGLAQSAAALARARVEDAAVAERDRETLEDKLARRRVLEGEVAEQRNAHAVFSALGNELRDNRIVEFLQGEAIALLARAATERLASLSAARYRLVYEDNEFFVVDGWNGDERRSVRTLSGGETFLASLALALALSEQVQLLAVSEKSKLESLFLDEGFGNLDAETLGVVVAAIEQLGGEDRLVGVITHVSEVADRMPVRLEVRKSSTGSTLGRSSAEPALV